MTAKDQFDTDVIVVGAGPTGGTAALALATYGVRVHAVSKWNWLANTPRAHVVNQRAIEVFRDLGIEEEAQRKATPWELMGDTTFTTSLAGPEIARLRTWGTGEQRHGEYVKGSPCPLLDLPQTLMEPILVNHAAARGAQFSFNTEYVGHEQDDTGVTVTLRDRLSGTVTARRAKYLIGADGARSQVAQDIGLEIVGEHARAGQIYARFNADLSRYVAHRPAVLHYIMHPDVGFGEIGMGAIRAVRAWDQWMAGWGFDQTKGGPDLDQDRALERIRSMVGDPGLEAEIEWVSPWYVNEARATTYSKGRVYCGGDAVHRHPPSSGLGSNTCIQDAFNLAWKLAFVIKGYAGERLLESYTAERAPVGEQIVARANQSRFDYAPLREAFAAASDSEDPAADGLAKIRARTPEGAKARAALAEAIDLKNYEFNAQGVELNQRYDSEAVVPDAKAVEEVWHRDRQLYLQATTRPGAKIPHTWLVDEHGRCVSTLDVVGKGFLTLVTGLSGQAWVSAADDLALPFLRTVVVGERGHEDLYGSWLRLREIDEAGALLVRPDGYVAWRIVDAVHEQTTAAELLRNALAAVLATSHWARTPVPSAIDQTYLLDATDPNTEGAFL
ncbi:FAD-dependent monooxygenase [Saccharopolyspora sp. NPDC049357]|uniref:FAD-dependent oxidoreductase n=1 Tax=Saccharopolyspora sp. NPDC049357 TaxID=3154507 RepID=UPI00344188E5